TALGHNESDYTTDTKFIRHIEEGIKYDIGNTLSLGTTLTQTKITLSPNPTPNTSKLVTSTPLKNVQVFDINGRTINQFDFAGKNVTKFELGDSNWKSGIYLIQVTTEEGLETLRLIKE
ncbi:MAG: T9SS type A sorting domain-containing protein, partial [Leeuwenhoekiella sp.]